MRFPISSGRVLGICLSLKKIFSRGEPYIFLTTMPKSASTFLHRALVELTEFESAYFASAYKNIEQELYQPALIDYYDVGSVTQQHTRANQINLDLLAKFRIRPVVLIRKIPDVIVSMRDHLINERPDNLPGLYPARDFADFDKERQLDFVTSYMGPWLVSFYASWKEAEKQADTDILWLQYETAVKDWSSAITSVITFHGIEKSLTEIETALDAIRTRKKTQLRINKAVIGRGDDMLSTDQHRRLQDLASAYPGIDFSPVGIQLP